MRYYVHTRYQVWYVPRKLPAPMVHVLKCARNHRSAWLHVLRLPYHTRDGRIGCVFSFKKSPRSCSTWRRETKRAWWVHVYLALAALALISSNWGIQQGIKYDPAGSDIPVLFVYRTAVLKYYIWYEVYYGKVRSCLVYHPSAVCLTSVQRQGKQVYIVWYIHLPAVMWCGPCYKCHQQQQQRQQQRQRYSTFLLKPQSMESAKRKPHFLGGGANDLLRISVVMFFSRVTYTALPSLHEHTWALLSTINGNR